MSDAGAFFYDRPQVFDTYLERRQQATSANDTLELPIIQALLPELRGRRVLDIGCGDAAIASELLESGAEHYTGFDSSERMIALAKKNLPTDLTIELHQDFIESWPFEPEAYDLVLSRLAFHYVEALGPIFERIYAALRPGGEFVFSVEHPVITSHQQSFKNKGSSAGWAVERYFETGKRDISWLGGQVLKYHRTVEDHFSALQEAGFSILALRESRPDPKLFPDRKLYEKRARYPLFLFFKAQKPSA